MKIPLLMLFSILFIFPLPSCSHNDRNKIERIELNRFILKESERKTGAYLNITAQTEGTVVYESGNPLPKNLNLNHRMITFKTYFKLPPDDKQTDWGLYTGLFEYPVRIYINGHLLIKRGRYENGHYNSSLRLAKDVYLPPEFLHSDLSNEIVIEAYPEFETWALDKLYISTYDDVVSSVFIRNFFGIHLLQGAFVLSLVIGIYFLILYFSYKKENKKYLNFSIFAILFCTVYFNVVIHHEASNEILMESLSKSTMILLALAMLIFIKNFTRQMTFNRFFWRILTLISIAASFIVFIQPDKESLLNVFGLTLNFLIIPILIFSFVLVLIYGIREKGLYFPHLFVSSLLLLAAFTHDAWFFINMKLPYIWMMNYGFLAMVAGIFSILVTEQTRLYQTSIRQAEILESQNREIEEMNEGLEQKIQERTSELEERNRRIMDSIYYAEMIQNSILPKPHELKEIFNDYFVVWKPRDIVGGDFYWFRKTEKGLLLAVADCTGHGVPGALMTMTAHSALNRIVDLTCRDDPAAILNEMDRILKLTIHHQHSAETEIGLEAALCYIIPEKKKLIYAGAGIPLYFNDENNNINRIKPDRYGIGYTRTDENFFYRNHELDLNPKLYYYLSSDGYLDQNGGKKDQRFGRKRFMEMLGKYCSQKGREQKKSYEKEILRHMGWEEQRDDITVFGFSGNVNP